MIEGLLISIVILLVEIVLKNRGGTIIERIENKIRPLVQEKGVVIEPLDELSEKIASKIKKNESEGKDTELKDL